MAKTLGYMKKAGLALTIACLLGSPLSAAWGTGAAPAEEKKDAPAAPADANKEGEKKAGYLDGAKKKWADGKKWAGDKAKPVTDHLSNHKFKYGMVLGVAVAATTKWLYEKGKVNYLVANDAVLQDEFRRIDENQNFDALEKADEKQKAVARRVAEYFADESILDAIMKSTQGLWSYLF